VLMAPPVKTDKSVAAFLKKNLEPDEELVAYVYRTPDMVGKFLGGQGWVLTS
jgi:hypothetical protein